jgi:hypothetical protein
MGIASIISFVRWWASWILLARIKYTLFELAPIFTSPLFAAFGYYLL